MKRILIVQLFGVHSRGLQERDKNLWSDYDHRSANLLGNARSASGGSRRR